MLGVVKIIDQTTEIIGRGISYLLLLMMILTCVVVGMRYVFQSGNIIFTQESVTYLHASVFLLGAGWTLKRKGHVRVDILYRKASIRAKAWIDAICVLIFLLPVSVFMFWISLDYVGRSWSILEVSSDAGGVPLVYLLKSLIPAMCVLLGLQGVAELIRNGIIICTNQSGANTQTSTYD